ncbi:hypothetical protein [Sulfurimonas sp.]|uniref:hypothetical protein n=1 Tax=Sulfurimonas sp. TaxID=2022749 RepID=UPI003D11E531
MLKNFIKILFLVISLLVFLYLYWNRSQTINFSDILPTELYRCNKLVNSKDKDYSELTSWLKLNQTGWQNTLVSYVPYNVYKNTEQSVYFHVNIMEESIVINYEDKNLESHQVIREKTAKELQSTCK